ncbi:unnamed protein product [Coffea canephora]|uniref:Uncharacterized protein n=1 Tax=Coffea canephora TaxID=49390 RepID=A0A068UJM1_COFCA|nr:unnamed protein product [Coffea canephora]
MPAAGPKIPAELPNPKIWKSKEIKEPSELRSLRLPNSLPAVKIWTWIKDEHNLNGQATSAVPPRLWQPSKMIIDARTADLKEPVPCLALTRMDSCILSALGGKVSLFDLGTFDLGHFEVTELDIPQLAFDPIDNNRVAIGRDDFVLQIYDIRHDKVIRKIIFHQDKVTGIIFSGYLDIMVTAGADAQICVWKRDFTKLLVDKFLEIPPGRRRDPLTQTRLQLHRNQIFLLVVHWTFIAVYKLKRLDCVCQAFIWPEFLKQMCILRSRCLCFRDGSISVFTGAALELRCRINPLAYLPSNPSLELHPYGSGLLLYNLVLHPLVIVAHPSDPSQFAVGLTDGGVYAIEPPESESPDNDDPE